MQIPGFIFQPDLAKSKPMIKSYSLRRETMGIKGLPKKGISREELFERMSEFRAKDADWRKARTWSLVYYAREDILELAKSAYLNFFSENGLNPMAFGSLRNFENEVLSMVADILNGGESAVGSMTSGGTESILLAVKTARDWALSKNPGMKDLEIILPISAHPAFEKACHYFQVKPVHIPLDKDFRADIDSARKAVNKNTIMLIGSAPCYPYGVIDPIPELAQIALEHNFLFHTDACLGGFMLPFMKKLGYSVIPFDFTVPGVTSISADIHKYGYSAKGASCVIYRSAELRKHQFYVYADWPGGVYASPSMTGTRPGGAIASAWAVINYLGEEGYLKLVEETMKIAEQLIQGINQMPGLAVMGKPDMSVFAFGSDKLNMFELGDLMEQRRWQLDRLQNPPALHLIVTPNHSKVVKEFLEDLKSLAEQLTQKGKAEVSGMAAIYGMIGTLPDRKSAHQFVLNFLDELFKPKK